MNNAILHAHSEFSVRDSLIRIEELPKVAAEKGWSACALTDHGGVEGVPLFMKAAARVGIKPIVGIEFYIGCPDTYGWGKYNKAHKLHHLTVIAKSAKGFSSILNVLSIGHRDYYDQRRQKAAIPLDLIIEKLEDVIVLSGCFSSPFWRGLPLTSDDPGTLREKTQESAAEDLARVIDRFGDDFYFEVQPLDDWGKQIELNRIILEMSRNLGPKIVVTPDCHFSHGHESIFHEALLAVADRKSIHDKNVWKFSTKLSYVLSPKEISEHLGMAGIPGKEAIRAVEATGEIADKVKAWTWDELPPQRLPDVGGNMKEIAWAGFYERGLEGKPEYRQRLEKELDVFMKAGLDKYLLLVRHCIGLFRKEGAEIGPRGSVGGSLVAYLMGITPLDPIAHKLPFERFYAPGRKGWPDVDIDLDEETRERAPEILRREFGPDKVAQISNFTTYKLRLAIKDAARAYGIRLEDDSVFSDDEKDAEDIEDIAPGKELALKSPDAANFARMLLGRVRQFGAHAGGFVISADSLYGGRSAVVSRGKDKALVWDMEVAESLGFVKMDFLGVDTLSAIKMVGQKTGIDWNVVPLDDPEVYKDFSEGRTAGVPQFLSPGMRAFIRSLKPTKFEDLVWANAAFRPGGLGQMTPDEMVRRYREDPDQIIVYQEEVMNLCVNLAGFTWVEADKIRKVMAKSEGMEELDKYRPMFVEGCKRVSGWSEEEASSLWMALLGFGRYAFNKAHASAYSWNSYRIAWAKRHFPVPTFLALLQSEKKNIQPILDEAPKFGVRILPPDPNKSGLAWSLEGNDIRMPITQVSGMDLRLAKIVIRERELKGPFRDMEDFSKRLSGYRYPDRLPEHLFSGKMPGYYFQQPAFDPYGIYTKRELEDLVRRERMCVQCELSKTPGCRAVPVEFGHSNVLVVGEAPGREENRKGRPFVGMSGRLLDETLFKFGVSGKKLTWTNVCHCQPPFLGKDQGSSRSKIEELSRSCIWLGEELKLLKPPLILAVGKRAWECLGGTGPITKSNGHIIDVNGSKIVACLHPAFVLRDRSRLPDFESAVEKFCDLYKSIYPVDQDRVERRLPEEYDIRIRAREIFGK